LLSRVQQSHPRGDDHERITRARQTAEALSTSKLLVSAPSVADTAPADQSVRKPRVLSIISTASARHVELETPVNPEPQTTPAIPASDFARIRTWVKYGMTVPQVAKVYGVAAGDIERILRQA